MFSISRRLPALLTFTIVVILAAGCSQEAREQFIQERQQEDEQLFQGKQTIQWDNIERTFRVHLPPSYSDAQEWPLVVALHAGGSNALSMELVTGFSNLADSEGFIVVYPSGTSTTGSVANAWNAGHCCGMAVDNNVDDVGFLREMLDTLSSNLSIDWSRIYFTGFSNGGMMSYRFAAECSDIVAAIAPVAATIGGKADLSSPLWVQQEPSEPVSVLAIHGTADPQVLYEGGHGPNTQGRRVDLSVAESTAFWIKANECDISTRSVSENNGVEHTTYSGGKQDTVVEIILIEGGEHTWPGSNADTVQKVDATPTVWEFFNNQ